MYIRYCINYIQIFDNISENKNFRKTENKFDIDMTYLT